MEPTVEKKTVEFPRQGRTSPLSHSCEAPFDCRLVGNQPGCRGEPMYQQFGVRAYRSLGMPAEALPKFDAEFYPLRMKPHCRTDDELFIFLRLTADTKSDVTSHPS